MPTKPIQKLEDLRDGIRRVWARFRLRVLFSRVALRYSSGDWRWAWAYLRRYTRGL